MLPAKKRGFTTQNWAFGQQRLGLPVHPHRDQDVLQVLGQRDDCTSTHVHVLVLDVRLAGLQALGAIEGDGDRAGRAWTRCPRPARRRSATVTSGITQIRENAPRAAGAGPHGGRRLCASLMRLSASWRAAASHISRGSNASAANIVRITTAAKATAPKPGSIVTTEPNCTSATRIDSMKMSIIDQRPIALTMRYSTVRSRSRPRQAGLRGQQHDARPTSFSTGTMMLAKNTSAASGYMPPASSSSTPPRMVLGGPAPSWITVSTG